jgi:hypothetical protein
VSALSIRSARKWLPHVRAQADETEGVHPRPPTVVSEPAAGMQRDGLPLARRADKRAGSVELHVCLHLEKLVARNLSPRVASLDHFAN